MTLVIFSLENICYSLDVMNVEEVVPLPSITPLASLPPFICGMVNLRGSAVPIINLRKRFGLKNRPDELDDQVIFVKFHDSITGLIVDKVLSVEDVSEEQFMPPPDMIHGIDIQYMSAAIQIGNDLTVILNLDNILTHKQTEELLELDISHEDIEEK